MRMPIYSMKLLTTLTIFSCILFLNTLELRAGFIGDSLRDRQSVRSLSMGGAYSSLAGDASAYPILNPAGVSYPGRSYSFQSLAYNQYYKHYQTHTLFLSPFAIAINDIKQSDTAAMNSMAISYGGKSKRGIHWGGTLTRSRFFHDATVQDTWSVDVGAVAHLLPSVKMAFSLHDVVQRGALLPKRYRAGMAFSDPKQQNVTLSGDIVYDSLDKDYQFYFGGELRLTSSLMFRSGFFENRPTFGFGIQKSYWSLNYGFVSKGSDAVALPARHVFSFSVGYKGYNASNSGQQRILVKKNGYAVLHLHNNIRSGQSSQSLFGGVQFGSNDLLPLIRAASQDPFCKGILLKIGSLSASLSMMSLVQEFRKELMFFKEQGKEVIAYIEHEVGLPGYYLASVADEIIMPEIGALRQLGISLEVIKFEKLLNKWGIKPVVFTSGAHKGRTRYESPKMKDVHRWYLETFITKTYESVLDGIRASRSKKFSWEEVAHLFDGRYILASEAKQLGLIDRVDYIENINKFADDSDLKSKKSHAKTGEKSFKVYPIQAYFNDKTNNVFSRYVAVIEVDGSIKSGTGGGDILFGGMSAGSSDIISMIEAVKKKDDIAACIIRVNSPGGGVLASDRMYNAVKRLSEKKPVYVSMGNVAASGGYYLSLGATKIFANELTLTGSVGVVGTYFDLREFSEKHGIEYDRISKGKNMFSLSPGQPLTPELQRMIQDRKSVV